MTDRIRLTAVIKNETDLAFIIHAGGNIGRGAKQAGFDALLAFAQMTPRAFQAFLGGREFADIGEIITVREGDYLCPVCCGPESSWDETAAAIAFAQHTPRAFQAFLGGEQIEDLLPCKAGEGCFKCEVPECRN